ncbi:ImmA/IrrE family metallo-endopeptidase [Parasediminibacterium sp. JCM 36343]|uniref:ImmA/IrrE family metallo-endopeptidase n=1 Tax=Parasediminibacterium sp. JCM 36343 TaxID=3374279 RepID=UPI00397DD29D
MSKWAHKSILNLINESGNTNPEDEIRSRARALVLNALQNGWSGPPFNAIELAKFLNIDIIPNDGVLDARTIPKGKNGFIIEYNPFQKPTRINFSVAHEIAHTFFSDCGDQIRDREDDPRENRELEKLCNIGASELQLPYAVFSNDVNKIDKITLEELIELAKGYKASLESLFLRFVQVVDKPCAVIICYFKNPNELAVDYCKESALFGLKIPNDFVIPQGSNAYECTAPGWSARETVKWDFLGNEYDIYCIGISPLRKENKARVGIIVTPRSYEENLQDKKITLEFGDATKPRGEGVKIIAQVVNTSGGLGLGFGKSLSKNFPLVKTELQKWQEDKSRFKLGQTNTFRVEKDIYICQMLAQKGLFEKNGEIPLKYPSLRDCLIELSDYALEIGATVHMPMIGAGQAKGDWNMIMGIIHDELIGKNIKVSIYMLPGKVPNIKTKSSLTLFKEESTWPKEK